MIDLRTIAPTPLGVTTDYIFESATRTGCEDGWVGAYTHQTKPYRLHHLKWEVATSTAAEALYLTLSGTAGGNDQVLFSPPNDPSSARVAQMDTIIGRLVPPFKIRQRGKGRIEIEADLREDV